MKQKLERFPGTAFVWCLLITVFLYTGRDSIYCQGFLSFEACYGIQVAFTAAGVLALLYRRRKQLKTLFFSRQACLFCLCLILYAIPMVIKRDWQMMYISVIFAIFVPLMLSFWVDSRQLSRYYVLTICFFSVCSVLINYVLRPLIDAGLFTSPTIFGDDGFYNLFFGVSCVNPALRNRNFGIFREPGVYQYFLILALYLNNDRAQWEKLRTVWLCNFLLVLTMLSTLALGGLVETALLAVILFFDKGWYRNRKAQVIAASGIVFLIAAYNIIHWIDGPLWGEIWMLKHKLFSGEDSVTDRTGSLLLNVRLFLAHPLFGARLREVLQNPVLLNNTSSTTILFAMTGVLGGAFHVFSWIAMTWKKNRNLLFSLGYALILSMSFNTENLITNVFFWLFPMVLLCERLSPDSAKEIH